MAPKVTDAPFSDQEGLNKFVADAREMMSSVKSDGEKIAKVELLAGQLQAGMDELQARVAQDAQYVASGTDADVTRAYTAPAANREHVIGGVADLRKSGEKIGHDRARWAGSDAGVVRMLGGNEDGFWEHGLLDDPKPKSEWQFELQRRVEQAAWIKALQGEQSPLFRAMRRGLVNFMRRGPPSIAKMVAANTGEGGEWIATLPLSMLERTVEIPRIIEGQFQEMPLSAKSVLLPFLSVGAQAFLHGVPAAGDLNPAQYQKSIPTSADRTLTAPTLAVNIPVENDAIEDSTIGDMLGLLQQLAGEALRDAKEDAIFNGDTAATHGDTALAAWTAMGRWTIVGSSLDHRKGHMGIRQRAFDVSNAVDQSASQTIAAYIGARSTLTTPHGVMDGFYATSPAHYLAKVIVDTNVLTVDKFGPAATIHTGQVASIGGSPLFLSQFMTEDLNASGVFDNVTLTYTGMVFVGRGRFRMARRRALRAVVERVEREGVTYVVASERAGLVCLDPAASVKNVWYGYKLAKT